MKKGLALKYIYKGPNVLLFFSFLWWKNKTWKLSAFPQLFFWVCLGFFPLILFPFIAVESQILSEATGHFKTLPLLLFYSDDDAHLG